MCRMFHVGNINNVKFQLKDFQLKLHTYMKHPTICDVPSFFTHFESTWILRWHSFLVLGGELKLPAFQNFLDNTCKLSSFLGFKFK